MRILSVGIKEYDKTKLRSISNCPSKLGMDIKTDLNKPKGSVLWGSTLINLPNGQITSSWNDFVNFDQFDSKKFSYGISFKLHKKARIMEIDSYESYIRIMDNYKMKIDNSLWRPYYCLDFSRISRDYDAFHVTEEAFLSLRMNVDLYDLNYADFYSYDAETWAIFNSECINEGSILTHGNIIDYEKENL